MRRIQFSQSRSAGESLREYGRGVAGGLMFSIPLFFTMEMWWSGFGVHPWRIIAFAGVTFLLLLLYNRYAGLRRDASFAEVVIDSVEEMGIGLLLSFGVLWLLGRIGADTGLGETLGRVVMEALPTAIGVSVGTAQLGAPDDGDAGFSNDEVESRSYLPQLAIALCGGVLFAANVAPTDEIAVLACESGPLRLLFMAVFSLGICTLVFHFADFRSSDKYLARDSWVEKVRGVASSYAIALIASAGLLWIFGRFDGETFSHCSALIVVLGMPTTFGASAGRLLVQSGGGSSSSS